MQFSSIKKNTFVTMNFGFGALSLTLDVNTYQVIRKVIYSKGK